METHMLVYSILHDVLAQVFPHTHMSLLNNNGNDGNI